MKFATFTNGGTPEIGVVQGDKIVPLAQILPDAPTDMVALMAAYESLKPALTAALDETHGLPLASVHLLQPVLRPGKMLAIGLNYADHIAETNNTTPEQQVWFAKAATSVHAPYDPIELPKISQKIDYEVELVAVIGKRGRHISAADAAAHVFGYCVGNDVSVRDWQRHSPQWSIAKSFDTHGPIGPWITTADEVGDPHRLDITCTVNGDVRQNSNTANLVFNVWAQIAYLSTAMTLEPGDVIFTGTPGGVGLMRKPPVFLQDGDLVRCEIAELGFIEAVMKDEV
jgi:2-keto-4-pentenoate hydratase/2-oxohepta-3-ene-1,7-dioic acid hydratase in catechol pathway